MQRQVEVLKFAHEREVMISQHSQDYQQHCTNSDGNYNRSLGGILSFFVSFEKQLSEKNQF